MADYSKHVILKRLKRSAVTSLLIVEGTIESDSQQLDVRQIGVLRREEVWPQLRERAGVKGPAMLLRYVGKDCPDEGAALEVAAVEGLPTGDAIGEMLEGVLSGRITRERAGEWAREGLSLHLGAGWDNWFWEERLRSVHVALMAVDTARQAHDRRGKTGWFLEKEDLLVWKGVLEGRIETELDAGWKCCFLPYSSPRCSVETVIRVPVERVESVLKRPFRLFDMFSYAEFWGVRDPEGRSYLLCAPTEVDNQGLYLLTCWFKSGEDVSPGAAVRGFAEFIDLDVDAHAEDGPSQEPLPRRWAVWRQDDNGNEARVSRHFGELVADRKARELERGGHKQDYWVQPVVAPGS